MFFILFSLVKSTNFSSNIVHLTDLPPNDGNNYFVMVHSDGCGHCARLAPAFSKASVIGEGFAIFAELNCNTNKTACQLLRIDGVPKLFLFSNGIINKYDGPQLSRLMANWITSFINDTALLVDSSNYTENVAENSTILFTSKPGIPKIWAAIEKSLNSTNIKFLISKDKELQAKLGLEGFPGIFAKKGDQFKKFSEHLDTRSVVHFLKSFYGISLSSDNKPEDSKTEL